MNNHSLLRNEFMENRILKSISIIDMHAHMGSFYGTYLPKASLKKMIEVMEKQNIETIVTSPHSSLFDPVAGNSELEEAMKEYPDRIKGYFTFNPNYADVIEKQMEIVLKIKGYVGFKFLPEYHMYPLDGEAYSKVLEFADENKLIVLSHTWGGSRYNSTRQVKNIVEKYKNLIFIMGHSAPGECSQAIELAKEYENVYLDLCDTHRLNGMIDKMVEAAGAGKVLFGTDMPWYDPNYCLGGILFSKMNDYDKCKIIYDNAHKLLQKFI